jgi:RHS repeat-associated protein
MPGGGTYELRRSDQVYQDNGTVSTTGTFYAVDGSRVRYDSTGPATGTLYMPDGTRYVLNNGSGQIIDRNGNTVSFDGSTRQWTDTLGRTISMPWPASPQATDYYYTPPGMPAPYIFKWRNLSSALTPDAQGQTPPLKAMSSHYLPSPGSDPTNQNSYNFPQASGLTSLFYSDYGDESADNPDLTYTYVVGRGQGAGQTFNPVVLAEIVLPDNSSYKFSYNVYGEVDKVIYPTGGYNRSEYGTVAMLGESSPPYTQGSRGVRFRWVSPKGTGGADEALWQYQGGGGMIRTIAPDQTKTETYRYNIFSPNAKNFGYQDARNGQTYEERVYDAAGTMVRRTLTDWAQASATYNKPRPTSGTPATGTYTAYRNARAVKTVNLLLDTPGDALTTTIYGYDTAYQFSTGVELTTLDEYHYAPLDKPTAQTGAINVMPIGAPARGSQTSYLTYDASYRNRNLLGLIATELIRDGSGNVVARKETAFDEGTYPLLTYGAVPGWSDPGTWARGNPTTVKQYIDPNAAVYVETHTQYDQCGSVRNAWDPHDPSVPGHGHMSQIFHDDAFSDDVGRGTYAYPTRTTSPAPDPSGARGSSTSLEKRTVYDYATGLVTATVDANGQTARTYYTDDNGNPDPLKRVRKVERPAGGGWTKYNYGVADNAGFNRAYVETVTAINAAQQSYFYQFYDGLGRLERTFNYVGPGAYDTADTQYDQMGRAFKTSLPYRTSGANVAIPGSAQWTTTTYDFLGRVRTVTTADGAVAETTYSGNEVTVIDQTSKRRSSQSDALGRMVKVIEDPLGAAYQTDYVYDVLGNVRKIDKAGQVRYFMYDGISRLTRARNPEQDVQPAVTGYDPVTGNTQWSLGIAYDPNGNIQSRTDARGVVTSYTYDTLNRQLTVSYQNDPANTPTVNLYYDNQPNARGQLWKTATANDYTETLDRDVMGRAQRNRQWFYSGGVWRYYDTTYSYDLAGHVITQGYPSGHTASYQYDVAGRLGDFRGNLGDGASRVYSTGLSYDEASRVKQEQFGTTTPVYNKSYYNVRGQLSEIRVATTANDTFWNRGAIINHYSEYSWAGSGTDNNGSLKKQDVYIPNDDAISGYSQTTFFYYYDALNRLDVTREVRDGANSWVQDYDYDQYGNRTINAANTWGAGINNKQFTVSTATNRLGVPAGQAGAMGYDMAGNLTTDSYSGNAGTRSFDAENRLYQELTTSNYLTARYTYDGGGRRVRRQVGGQEVWCVYGLGGELIAEYGAGFTGTSVQQEYGYRNGELLVTASGYGDQGLQAEYYNSLDFTSPALTRTDSTVNFDWGGGSPAAGVGVDNFTTRWTGFVTPLYTQTYTFYTVTDDGVRLWVNGQLVIDKWIDQAPTEWSGQITLEANKRYSIKMEFYERGGGAMARLYWSSASQAKEIIPAGRLSPPQGGAVKWLVNDQLGTPRMAIDQTGALAKVTRHDYLPFGEELGAGAGGRTYLQGCQADGTRQQFTGHERDAETGLDFMQARHYNGQQGRFVSVDTVSGKLTDPQSLNLYAYVDNNPLRYTDPSGHMLSDIGVLQTDDPATAARAQAAGFNDWIRTLQAEKERKQAPRTTQTQAPQQQQKRKEKPKQTAIAKQLAEIKKNAKELKPGEEPVPTTMVYLEGDNITYDGDPITLPDGTPDPLNTGPVYYGAGKINAIVILDQGGNIMPGAGFEIGERITPNNAEAQAMQSKGAMRASQDANGQPERVPFEKSGVHWDRVLAVSQDKSKVPAQFDIQVTQRLYVYAVGQKQALFLQTNQHQETQNGAQSQIGPVRAFPRKQ